MTIRRGAIGVDVGGTGTKAALVTELGEKLTRLERRTDPHAGTKGVIDIVDELLGEAADLGVEVSAIGVGAAGFVDVASGTVTFAPNLSYDDPHVRDAVEARTGLPAVVDNDANAAVWGERAHGAAQGSDHIAYIGVGTGIGSGFVVEGRLVRGYTGAGAEAGHTVVEGAGVPCGCGLRGCLEQYASGQAITRLAKEALAGGAESSIVAFAGSVDAITPEDVSRAAREYDETARAVLKRAGRALGVGLSNVANIFDPEVIVLGGGVIGAGEPFLGPARDELARMTAAQRRRPLRLVVTSLAGDNGIIGAAALARHEATGDGRATERPERS
jgi:glucokinase